MERNKRKSALVVGGAVAGPLVALALRKIGWTVHVVDDRSPDPASTQGAWLTVAANGLAAMRTLGVERQIMAAGFPSHAIELASGTGRVLGSVPLGARAADGLVTHTVRRADLCSVLARAAEQAGASSSYGRRLVSIEDPAGNGVTARFADGTAIQADLLVGADGIWSTVRRQLDPQAPEPRYGGLGDVGGFTPRRALSHPESDALAPGVYRMVFGREAFFGYTVAPEGDVWWFANPVWPVPRDREALRRATDTERRAELIQLFAGDAGPMAELIEGAEGAPVVTHQYDLPRVKVWSRGRVVLVGDAAHAAKASSGQGVSMAAEDAVELARCLRDLPMPEALPAFVEIRRARTERVVAFGKRNANGKALGPIGATIRDAMMPMMLRHVTARWDASTAWLFQHRIDWSESVPRSR